MLTLSYVRLADSGSIYGMPGGLLGECVVLTGYEKSLKDLPLLPAIVILRVGFELQVLPFT